MRVRISFSSHLDMLPQFSGYKVLRNLKWVSSFLIRCLIVFINVLIEYFDNDASEYDLMLDRRLIRI